MNEKSSEQTLIDVKKQVETLENRIIFLSRYADTLINESQKDNVGSIKKFELLDKHYSVTVELNHKKDLLANKMAVAAMHEKYAEGLKENKYIDANFAAMIKEARNSPMTVDNARLRKGIIERFGKGYQKYGDKKTDFKLLANIIQESKINYTPVNPE